MFIITLPRPSSRPDLSPLLANDLSLCQTDRLLHFTPMCARVKEMIKEKKEGCDEGTRSIAGFDRTLQERSGR